MVGNVRRGVPDALDRDSGAGAAEVTDAGVPVRALALQPRMLYG